MIIVLPDWYPKAREKLNECIDNIVRDINADWHFSHDSIAIKDAKNTILNALVTIKEQVHNPFQPSDEEIRDLNKLRIKDKKATRKQRARKVWTNEVFDYVKKNLHLTNKQIAQLINDKFGIKTSGDSLSVQMSKRGIKRTGGQRNFTSIRFNRWDEKVIDFIKENMNAMKNPVLAEKINEKFSFHTNAQGVSVQMAHHGLKRTKHGNSAKKQEEEIDPRAYLFNLGENE